jgi:predicted Rossmann fold flavoprotein
VSGRIDTTTTDVVVIGAGAAGLFAAGVAGQRGLRVLLIDHAPKVAEKIRISGGGRSNFTNKEVAPANFLSANPHFSRSALAQYSSQDFIALVQSHGIAFHEKHKGQLFCDRSSQDLIDMLMQECAKGQVTHWQPCSVHGVAAISSGGTDRFELHTDQGVVRCRHLIIATGGLSIPKIGATDWGQRLAQQFGHTLVPLRPALVPLTFNAQEWARWVPMAGVSLPVQVSVQAGSDAPFDIGQHKRKGKTADMVFHEDLLFTHRGLSGPAILQISSYWAAGHALTINLVPGADMAATLKQAKQGARKQLGNAWRELLPSALPHRLADTWMNQFTAAHPGVQTSTPLAETKDRELDTLGQQINGWAIAPNGTEGYAKAEVTAGGVNTHELHSQRMESKCCPGLYFIGEVVDVTGWLGGYNFQWAWSSAMACARSLDTAKIAG